MHGGALANQRSNDRVPFVANRDLIRLDERGLKMLMLSYLSMSEMFLAISEQELARGYSDLILTLNRRYDARYSFLVELTALQGRSRLGNRPVHAVLAY